MPKFKMPSVGAMRKYARSQVHSHYDARTGEVNCTLLCEDICMYFNIAEEDDDETPAEVAYDVAMAYEQQMLAEEVKGR